MFAARKKSQAYALVSTSAPSVELETVDPSSEAKSMTTQNRVVRHDAHVANDHYFLIGTYLTPQDRAKAKRSCKQINAAFIKADTARRIPDQAFYRSELNLLEKKINSASMLVGGFGPEYANTSARCLEVKLCCEQGGQICCISTCAGAFGAIVGVCGGALFAGCAACCPTVTANLTLGVALGIPTAGGGVLGSAIGCAVEMSGKGWFTGYPGDRDDLRKLNKLFSQKGNLQSKLLPEPAEPNVPSMLR